MSAAAPNLADLTAHELADRFAAGEATAVAATEAALERIRATDERLHAFLTVTGEQALRDAAAADAARERGERLGPLAGVPLALKDVLVTKGVRTTAGSRILEEAEKIKRLPTEGVPPTAHPLPRVNVWREDLPGPCLTQEEALSTAPEVEQDRFMVPRIIEEEP